MPAPSREALPESSPVIAGGEMLSCYWALEIYAPRYFWLGLKLDKLRSSCYACGRLRERMTRGQDLRVCVNILYGSLQAVTLAVKRPRRQSTMRYLRPFH